MVDGIHLIRNMFLSPNGMLSTFVTVVSRYCNFAKFSMYL